MSLRINGKTTAKHQTSSSNAKSQIIIRQAHIWEAYRIGEIAAKTYFNTPLTKFLSPYRHKYPTHFVRGFKQRYQANLLNPRNLTFVACEASNPSYPIGYAQFLRIGNDEGAKKQIASRWSIGLLFLSWIFWLYCKVQAWLIPDKSVDPKALADFSEWEEAENEKHWNHVPERQNRWYAQSVVVETEFQGRGIGKLLMMEIIKKAEEEGVCVGLEASAPGEHMYRSVGFKLLGPFSELNMAIEKGGGIMMWSPSSWEAKEQPA
jgi:GNAT superfamily N-acetyltransferase